MNQRDLLQCVGMLVLEKNRNDHVAHAEAIARSPGFLGLRDRIIELGQPLPDDVVVDMSSGAGLLSPAIAQRGSRVWAVDIAAAMTEYLSAKAASAGLENGETDGVGHQPAACRRRRRPRRVQLLLPPPVRGRQGARAGRDPLGAPLVFGDTMFRVSLTEARERDVVRDRIRAVRRGVPGLLALAKNEIRFAGRRWEQPARAMWWHEALLRTGFKPVEVEELAHEDGVASARRP